MVVYKPNTNQAAPTKGTTLSTKTASTNLNSSVNVDRELLLQISQNLNDEAQQLAASVEARLETPLNDTTGESQDNTKQLLDWVADLYAIAADINAYLNPEVEE